MYLPLRLFSEAAVFLKIQQKHEYVLWSWDIKCTYHLL